MLGTPLYPWQQQVADVALEVDELGHLVYSRVILTVPRQQGKSTLLLPVMVHRMLGMAGLYGRQSCVYTAQTATMARKKFLKEYDAALQATPLKAYFTTLKGMGQASMTWTNGSEVSIAAPTEKGGHGDVLDLGMIDEAFAQPDSRLEVAMEPAMQTRESPQLWIISTAGNENSTYFRSQVDKGRAIVESGRQSAIAYFEWSAPEDADPFDEETWWSCMPALGLGTPVKAVRDAAEKLPLDDFCRSYLNQWRYGKTQQQVIDAEHWTSCADPGCPDDCPLSHKHDKGMTFDDDEPLVLAVDVSPSRTQAAIGAAGLTVDGAPGVEVIDTADGTEWCVPRLGELRDKLAARGQLALLVVDGIGPAASLVPELLEDGWVQTTSAALDRAEEPAAGQLLVTNRGDMTSACGQLYDLARSRRLRHRAQPSLNAALASASKRDVGEAWAWGRKTSSGDITPLVAVTLAQGMHARHVRAGTKLTPFAESYF